MNALPDITLRSHRTPRTGESAVRLAYAGTHYTSRESHGGGWKSLALGIVIGIALGVCLANW